MRFIFLSKKFYSDYSHCKEIEQKQDRPYVMAIVKLNRFSFAVPMRSHIKHKLVLWTDEANSCGLDFSKSIVLHDPEYINIEKIPTIRQNEFNALKGKEHIVQMKLVQYIRTYKKAKERMDVPRNKIICEYSTLQYFEKYIRFI